MTSYQWNLLSTPSSRRATAQFALRVISGREFVRQSPYTTRTVARVLVDTYGVNKAREVARKALKRRGVLTPHNLVNNV